DRVAGGAACQDGFAFQDFAFLVMHFEPFPQRRGRPGRAVWTAAGRTWRAGGRRGGEWRRGSTRRRTLPEVRSPPGRPATPPARGGSTTRPSRLPGRG